MQGLKPSTTRLFGVLVAVICGVFTTTAHADYTDHSLTVEKNIQTYVVNADGSFELDFEQVSRINEERAIKPNAQHSVSFNRTLETLDIVEAYTLKPDGRKVQVGADQIKEQQEQASAEAPMFQDSRVKVVIFPELTVGDRMVLRYKRHRTTPLFPGQFEDLYAPDFYQNEQISLTYDMPANMALHADMKAFKASAPTTANGRTVYRWTLEPIEKNRIENGAVAYTDYGQFLAVSTFTDYAQFAQAYAARAQVEVTPAITQLARQLTAKLDTPHSKALALSDWVRKNIRYVAVYVGVGGVVPHPAQAVLDNRYGDCKDHVALLEALLKAVAIESTPVLINMGNAYVLPKVPTTGLLNHAITYIPGLDLYLDSTATPIAAGYLPIPELGKPVLLTQSGTLARTPVSQLSHVDGALHFKINPQGAADFTNENTVKGWGAEFNRFVFKSMNPTDRNLMTQHVLSMYGQTGSGVIETDPLDGSAPAFTSTVKGQTQNLVNLPGPTGVPALSSLAGGIGQNVFSFMSEKDRTQNFTCTSGTIKETAQFDFPKEVNILAVPKAVSLNTGGFSYQTTYVKQANSVLITRSYAFAHPEALCSPQDFLAMKPAIEGMVNDLKSQIIVQTL
jgi:transglutaminase-like putative cysteine protease